MAVLLKRSTGGVPPECPYGCCTEVYGRNVVKVRRRMKRASEREWRRTLARSA